MSLCKIRVGAREGVKYFVESQEDESIKATVRGPDGDRERLLTNWESADKWVNAEVTNILTGGRYETK